MLYTVSTNCDSCFTFISEPFQLNVILSKVIIASTTVNAIKCSAFNRYIQCSLSHTINIIEPPKRMYVNIATVNTFLREVYYRRSLQWISLLCTIISVEGFQTFSYIELEQTTVIQKRANGVCTTKLISYVHSLAKYIYMYSTYILIIYFFTISRYLRYSPIQCK